MMVRLMGQRRLLVLLGITLILLSNLAYGQHASSARRQASGAPHFTKNIFFASDLV